MTHIGKAYSVDLRKRVVAAVDDEGMERGDAAAQFRVGIATVYRWMRRAAAGESLEPLPRGHRRKSIPDEDLGTLRELVAQKPDRTVAELTSAYVAQTQRAVSASSITRALARAKLTLKKKSSRRSSATATTSKKPSATTSRKSRG
jgi:putative transposase